MATVKKIEQSIATLIMVIIYLSIFLGGSIYICIYTYIYRYRGFPSHRGSPKSTMTPGSLQSGIHGRGPPWASNFHGKINNTCGYVCHV